MKTDYKAFIIEKDFQSLLDYTMMITERRVETDSEVIYDDDGNIKKMMWNYKDIPTFKEKLVKFVNSLPKEKIKEYYDRYINFVVNKMPKISLKKIVILITSIFLTVSSFNTLITNNKNIPYEVRHEIEMVEGVDDDATKVSFNIAQRYVSDIEKGYSNDKHDVGNYIDTKYGKRFIGTKYGISAPVLQKYLNRMPTADDMRELSYKDATKILKQGYWDATNLDKLNNQFLANVIYDGNVNQGINAMRDVVKNALKDNDIIIDDSTDVFSTNVITKINKSDKKYNIAKSILDYRTIKYKQSPSAYKYLKGWLNRLEKFNIVLIEITKNNFLKR